MSFSFNFSYKQHCNIGHFNHRDRFGVRSRGFLRLQETQRQTTHSIPSQAGQLDWGTLDGIQRSLGGMCFFRCYLFETFCTLIVVFCKRLFVN